jgi:hypothetical protein
VGVDKGRFGDQTGFMMAKSRWLVGLGVFEVLGLSILMPLAVQAGWEGELRNSGKGAPKEVQGRKVEIQGHRMRMETEMAGMGRSVFIVDWKTGKAQTVLDSNRMVLEMDLRAAAQTAGLSVPWCEPGRGAVEQCLKAQGFSKVGSEAANGHPCEIYEQKSSEGMTRIWRPMGLDGLPALRTVRLNASGKEEFRSDILNVAKKEFEAKRFEVPANYIKQDMTAMMGAMMKAGAAKKAGKRPKSGN